MAQIGTHELRPSLVNTGLAGDTNAIALNTAVSDTDYVAGHLFVSPANVNLVEPSNFTLSLWFQPDRAVFDNGYNIQPSDLFHKDIALVCVSELDTAWPGAASDPDSPFGGDYPKAVREANLKWKVECDIRDDSRAYCTFYAFNWVTQQLESTGITLSAAWNFRPIFFALTMVTSAVDPDTCTISMRMNEQTVSADLDLNSFVLPQPGNLLIGASTAEVSTPKLGIVVDAIVLHNTVALSSSRLNQYYLEGRKTADYVVLPLTVDVSAVTFSPQYMCEGWVYSQDITVTNPSTKTAHFSLDIYKPSWPKPTTVSQLQDSVWGTVELSGVAYWTVGQESVENADGTAVTFQGAFRLDAPAAGDSIYDYPQDTTNTNMLTLPPGASASFRVGYKTFLEAPDSAEVWLVQSPDGIALQYEKVVHVTGGAAQRVSAYVHSPVDLAMMRDNLDYRYLPRICTNTPHAQALNFLKYERLIEIHKNGSLFRVYTEPGIMLDPNTPSPIDAGLAEFAADADFPIGLIAYTDDWTNGPPVVHGFQATFNRLVAGDPFTVDWPPETYTMKFFDVVYDQTVYPWVEKYRYSLIDDATFTMSLPAPT